jgi:hypothetical protein
MLQVTRRQNDPNFATLITKYKTAYVQLLKVHRMMMAGGVDKAFSLHHHYLTRCERLKQDLSPAVVARAESAINKVFGLEE